ncbi:hypothetical protein HDE_06230 [Halotydeus destructor]|nr:hypothetical protein HDE_06230 [Halotydeus destructor]
MLKKEEIGITPIAGYSARKSSMNGRAWLDGEETRLGRRVEREVALGNYYADGFDRQTNTVYEFWGCLWHGCECKFQNDEQTVRIGDRILRGPELRLKVQQKLDYYRRRNFKVIEMKECDFLDRLYPRSRGVPEEAWEKDYYENQLSHLMRLQIKNYWNLKNKKLHCNIRESFYGGRTGHCAMFYECKENEELRYLDFTSLYPDVLKNQEYPIGHPEVLSGSGLPDDELLTSVNEKEIFGFVSCTILPPKRRMHAILPVRNEGKLLFPLCGLCAMTENKSDCRHADDERMLTGTWCTAELYAALDNRYRLITVHEALHYEQKSEELFKSYINMWLRIKQEASGWPQWVQKEQEKSELLVKQAEDEFIEYIYQRTGTRLTKEDIETNSVWPPKVQKKREDALLIARSAEDCQVDAEQLLRQIRPACQFTEDYNCQ